MTDRGWRGRPRGPALAGDALLALGLSGGQLALLAAAGYLPPRAMLAAAGVPWRPALAYQAATAAHPPATLAGMPRWYLLVLTALLAGGCVFVGRMVHTRRAHTAAQAQRAAAETSQRVLAARAVAEERRRIARELHDLVAHHVAVMGVLATGARRAAGRDLALGDGGRAWETIDEVLATIEQTGRTVLREMRRLLEVLRSDSDPAAPGRPAAGGGDALAPQPTLAAVEALVDQVREAGLPVTLRVEGDPGPLDPGVALTVYRVVQEALTNVLKHAGPATAEIRIVSHGGPLRLEVFDTGRGPAPGGGTGTGLGLVSMRERVHLLGGTLRAGPRPGGGFRVHATIPVEPTEQIGEPG